MRQFIAFIKKEFYHIFRDRRTMLILLGMPVVQIILFGFAISTEVKNVRLAVLDPSNDVVTRKIIDRLDASEYFTVTARFHSPQEMEAAFLKNEVDMAIVFSERFADDLYTGDARVQLIVDATDPNMSTSQVNYATGIVSMVGQEMIPPNMSAARLTPDIKLLYNPQMKSAYNFVPGVMGLILMLICAMMTSISIVREKETGTMESIIGFTCEAAIYYFGKGCTLFCAVVRQSDNDPFAFGLCVGCSGGRKFVLVNHGIFAVYLRILGIGLIDFISHTYTGCGHAGFRIDADDAHDAFIGHDFPYREYAGDTSMDLGYTSGTLVYTGCA